MSLGSHLLFYISCYIVKEFVNLKILECSWSYFTFLKLCVFLYTMIESFMHQLLYIERWWDLHITCSIWVYLALSEESVLHLSCNSRKPQTLHTKTEIENWSIIGSLDMIPDCMEEILLSIWEPKMSFTKVLSQWCNQALLLNWESPVGMLTWSWRALFSSLSVKYQPLSFWLGVRKVCPVLFGW